MVGHSSKTKIIEVEEGTLVGEELRIPDEGAVINRGKKRGDLIIKFNTAAILPF